MTVKGARARGAVAAVLASVSVAAMTVFAGRADAHPEISALGTNRYVTAAVFDGRIDVSDVWLEGTLVSGDERPSFDADRDGRISDAEIGTAEARLRRLGPAISVELDGHLLPLNGLFDVGIDLGGDPSAADGPLVVERRVSFPGAWTPGTHQLRVSIAREPSRPLDTEIGVVLGPGLTLRDGPDRVIFRGPRVSALEERAGAFTFEAPRPPRGPGRTIAVVAVVVVAAGTLALGAWLRRRRSI